MRREALKIELSEKLNELEQKMRRAMAWKVTQSYNDNILHAMFTYYVRMYVCMLRGQIRTGC